MVYYHQGKICNGQAMGWHNLKVADSKLNAQVQTDVACSNHGTYEFDLYQTRSRYVRPGRGAIQHTWACHLRYKLHPLVEHGDNA